MPVKAKMKLYTVATKLAEIVNESLPRRTLDAKHIKQTIPNTRFIGLLIFIRYSQPQL